MTVARYPSCQGGAISYCRLTSTSNTSHTILPVLTRILTSLTVINSMIMALIRPNQHGYRLSHSCLMPNIMEPQYLWRVRLRPQATTHRGPRTSTGKVAMGQMIRVNRTGSRCPPGKACLSLLSPTPYPSVYTISRVHSAFLLPGSLPPAQLPTQARHSLGRLTSLTRMTGLSLRLRFHL